MPRDDDKSLGDEATLQGGKPAPADDRSLGDRSTFGGGDGSSLSDLGEFADLPDHDMEIVDLSSRYKIEKSLGKGGMGEVLLATDTRLDRKVAIKRIRGDAGSSKAAVARFLTEAKSVAALSHNNVVQIHDYGRDEEGPFLIMEYVAGGTLLDRCKQGPIELEEAAELACQLCDGLARAHDAGIIHRDIKPANILLSDDGVPKLTDFGLAKAESRDHTMTMAGAVLGTLDFMPPEQRQDASLVDARSDLWSLAATLYQMVTAKSPKIIRFDSLPQSLTNVLGQALEENKTDRYQSASELKEALQHSLHGGHVASVELEQGVCPSCGTRNEASRKFCRNTSCAASLQVKCLSCSATIPVWDGVCGECGSIQTDLLEQRREEMTSQKLEAETFLAEHDYKRATELAIEIGNETDPRLQQLKSWREEFPEQVESTKRVQVENAKQAIAEALSHEKAYDYRSGIKAFAQIPETILAGQDLPDIETARNVLARLQEKQGHADTLEAEIKSRIKTRNLSGLLSQVESLLELLPERADLLKLQQQLQKRESDVEKARVKTLAAAKASMQQHDYAGALSVIAKLNPEKIDNELSELQSVAERRETRCQELIRQIRQPVNAHQYAGSLALIEQYLTLKPNDAEALMSRGELIARAKKHNLMLMEDARSLENEHYYADAVSKLQEISTFPHAEPEGSQELRLQIEQTLQKLRTLDERICEAILHARWDVLNATLDEYLALQMHDEKRQQLKSDLRSIENAKQAFAIEDYDGVAEHLAEVMDNLFAPQCKSLMLETMRTRVSQLIAACCHEKAIAFIDEVLSDRLMHQWNIASASDWQNSFAKLRKECLQRHTQQKRVLFSLNKANTKMEVEAANKLVASYGAQLRRLGGRDSVVEEAYADFKARNRKTLITTYISVWGAYLACCVIATIFTVHWPWIVPSGFVFCLVWSFARVDQLH